MAIAHVCLGCGLDLARHRALLEPHYGLPLVTCSRCGRSQVRRRHPIQQQWRQFLRLAMVLLIAAVQIIILMMFTAFTIFLAYAHADLVSIRRLTMLDGLEWSIAVLAIVALPMFIGAWLGSTFHHWPYRTQWLGWAGVVLFFGWILPVCVHAHFAEEFGAGAFDWRQWRGALIVFIVMWIISLGGMPIAALLRQAAAAGARQRWRARRARMRRRRSASND